MMEYTNKYWNMLMPFIKKSLNKRYGKAYTKALITKADTEYCGLYGFRQEHLHCSSVPKVLTCQP